MKIKNNKIVEATEQELFDRYLKMEYDDAMTFKDYKRRMKSSGVKITKNDSMSNEEALRVLEYFQNWRRGAETEMPDPAISGQAIDIAIQIMKKEVKI